MTNYINQYAEKENGLKHPVHREPADSPPTRDQRKEDRWYCYYVDYTRSCGGCEASASKSDEFIVQCLTEEAGADRCPFLQGFIPKDGMELLGGGPGDPETWSERPDQ